MATYITVEQKAAQQLLEANSRQTTANRAGLAKQEQERRELLTQPQPVTQVFGGRRPVLAGDQLAATRRAGFRSDYLVLSYQFTTGRDLDTRTRLYLPTTRELSVDVGWSRDVTIEVIPGIPIVTWAGDNTERGFESVLIDVIAYRDAFPASNEIILRTAANWFGERGNAVTLVFVGYLGGAMILQEELFNWSNPTALTVYNRYNTYTTTGVTSNEPTDVDGDFITYVYFTLNTGRLNYRQSLPVA